MPRRAARKCKLTELYVRKLRPAAAAFVVWDSHQRGLGLKVTPTGAKSWKAVYSRHGRPRWMHLGAADAVPLAGARELAAAVMLAVARGGDPAAEKRAQRSSGTFADLARRYLEQYAKRHNRSWRQADGLVRRSLLPYWGKLPASSITRADVKAMMARARAPIAANQTLAAASAIFTWANNEELIASNPCRGIDRNPTTSRERVLSATEVPQFWAAFGTAGLVAGSALKMILLSGQRPGEVSHMRHEHIVDDGWWEMPGKPIPAVGWPGTKNSQAHRVWLPAPARALIEELVDGPKDKGFVFASVRPGRQSESFTRRCARSARQSAPSARHHMICADLTAR
jgi:integrase